MARDKFSFTHNNEELIFLVCKGDYINLREGAELGIYKSLKVNGVLTGQWIVDKDHKYLMTLTF